MLTAGSTTQRASAKNVDCGFVRNKTASGTAYHEAGSGEPLVLIHGVGMRLEAWAPQIAFLSATHRVIAVDLPGHGESAGLAKGSRLEEFVAWFGRFLDEMAIEMANVAGHSMGALVSGGAAATFGSRIKRVAYLNGVYRRNPEAKAAVLARAAAIPLSGVDKEGPLTRWFGDDQDSAFARELTRKWLNLVDPEGYAVAMRHSPEEMRPMPIAGQTCSVRRCF
jgi:pimeloyl-ACP methyl ester carboxylesterase